MIYIFVLQLIFSIIAFAVVAEYDGWSKINYMVRLLCSRCSTVLVVVLLGIGSWVDCFSYIYMTHTNASV